MAGWGGVLGTIGRKTVGGDEGGLIQAAGNALDIYGSMATSTRDASRARAQVAQLGQMAADAAANANEQIAIDNALRSRILTQTGTLGGTLAAAQKSMGAFGGTYYDENALNNKIAERSENYRSMADRAVDRVASITWGNAVSRGVDAGSIGDDIRQQLNQQANQIYQDSYMRAISDAIAEMQGRQALTYGGLDQMAKMRAAALSEIASVIAPQISAETALFGRGLAAGSQLDYSALTGSKEAAQIRANMSAATGKGLGKAFDDFSANDADAIAKLLKGTPKTPAAPMPALPPGATLSNLYDYYP
jgi:hypothetical protein